MYFIIVSQCLATLDVFLYKINVYIYIFSLIVQFTNSFNDTFVASLTFLSFKTDYFSKLCGVAHHLTSHTVGAQVPFLGSWQSCLSHLIIGGQTKSEEMNGGGGGGGEPTEDFPTDCLYSLHSDYRGANTTSPHFIMDQDYTKHYFLIHFRKALC